MTIEQTIEVPESHRITLDLPPELPVGKAKITVTPEMIPCEKTVRPLESLLGIHKGLDTMDAYFTRKRIDKALEDSQYERSMLNGL